MKEQFVITEKELSEMARRVVETLASSQTSKAKVLFLDGDLGAGKTTFTKEIAEVLGILKDEVHSPTFILKKEYKGDHGFFKKLIHIDAYRFDTKEEANVLRLENDLNEEDNLIVIEWPSKTAYKNPDMTVTFSVLDDETRNMEVNYARS